MAKGPFMEFLRANILQSAANTYTEVQIPTPASKTENMAMLIHQLELYASTQVDATPTQGDSVTVHISKAPRTIHGTIKDTDILAHFTIATHLAAVFHNLTETGARIYKFDPPILYPKSNIYGGIGCTGFTVANLAIFRIGYTLEKVSREDFISALVE